VTRDVVALAALNYDRRQALMTLSDFATGTQGWYTALLISVLEDYHGHALGHTTCVLHQNHPRVMHVCGGVYLMKLLEIQSTPRWCCKQELPSVTRWMTANEAAREVLCTDPDRALHNEAASVMLTANHLDSRIMRVEEAIADLELCRA
jgi:hypothetical protein